MSSDKVCTRCPYETQPSLSVTQTTPPQDCPLLVECIGQACLVSSVLCCVRCSQREPHTKPKPAGVLHTRKGPSALTPGVVKVSAGMTAEGPPQPGLSHGDGAERNQVPTCPAARAKYWDQKLDIPTKPGSGRKPKHPEPHQGPRSSMLSPAGHLKRRLHRQAEEPGLARQWQKVVQKWTWDNSHTP